MHYLLRYLRRMLSERGVISIEFSFISIIFIAFVFILFELCRIIYIITAIDYSLGEAARRSAYKDASKQGVSYRNTFESAFYQQDRFWNFFINSKDFTFDVKFCASINELTTHRCASTLDNKRRLALYSVAYRYRPFNIISGSQWSESLFKHLDSQFNRKVTYFIESSS